MSTNIRGASRLEREAKFHDEYAAKLTEEDLLVDEMFTSVTAMENQYILDVFGDLRGKHLLDYGCGSGEASVYFAKLGARVVAIDVSNGMLEKAQELARDHGVEIETRLVTSDSIPAAAAEFDLVYGNGVLHHVDLDTARRELARVLKPSGTGCFIEPLTYNPVIDVYRRIAGTIRTEDERPLSFADIESFGSKFRGVEHREFWLSTLLVFIKFFVIDRVHPKKERYWRKIYAEAEKLAPWFTPLKRLDEIVLRRAPALGRFCWTTVITVSNPIEVGQAA